MNNSRTFWVFCILSLLIHTCIICSIFVSFWYTHELYAKVLTTLNNTGGHQLQDRQTLHTFQMSEHRLKLACKEKVRELPASLQYLERNTIENFSEHDHLRKARSTRMLNNTGIVGCLFYLDTQQKLGNILKWKDHSTGGLSFITEGVALNKGEKVQVAEAGVYEVYSSLQLDAYAWDPAKNLQVIQHNLVKDPGGELITYNRFVIKRNDSIPTKINVLVYLQKDDELFININDPLYIYLQPETNFFGLIKLA